MTPKILTGFLLRYSTPQLIMADIAPTVQPHLIDR